MTRSSIWRRWAASPFSTSPRLCWCIRHLGLLWDAVGRRDGQQQEVGLTTTPLHRRRGQPQFAGPVGETVEAGATLPVLDAGANVAMLLALHASLLSLTGVLISLYPAATVVLAMVVLRERVTRWQALGMILAAVSVSMIAAK